MNQQEINTRIQQFLTIRLSKENTINAMLEMDIVDLDIEHKTITLAFPVKAWELNPVNHMHGGMICAALDVTMGCVSYVFTEASFTPTIQISVNFVKGIKENETLLVQGICDHAGSRMAQARSIARLKRDNEVVATGNGSYAINTHK